ncbi:hypothetical protein HK102_011440, partial [Quaeritorhiza haematococci]
MVRYGPRKARAGSEISIDWFEGWTAGSTASSVAGSAEIQTSSTAGTSPISDSLSCELAVRLNLDNGPSRSSTSTAAGSAAAAEGPSSRSNLRKRSTTINYSDKRRINRCKSGADASTSTFTATAAPNSPVTTVDSVSIATQERAERDLDVHPLGHVQGSGSAISNLKLRRRSATINYSRSTSCVADTAFHSEDTAQVGDASMSSKTTAITTATAGNANTNRISAQEERRQVHNQAPPGHKSQSASASAQDPDPKSESAPTLAVSEGPHRPTLRGRSTTINYDLTRRINRRQSRVSDADALAGCEDSVGTLQVGDASIVSTATAKTATTTTTTDVPDMVTSQIQVGGAPANGRAAAPTRDDPKHNASVATTAAREKENAR